MFKCFSKVLDRKKPVGSKGAGPNRVALAFLFGVPFVGLATCSSARAELELGISSSNYVGNGAEGRQKSYSSFDFAFSAHSTGGGIETKALSQGLISFNDSDYRFIEFPEAYVAYATSGGMKFYLGRRLEEWTTIDDVWGMGAWSPRFRWDYLRPQQVGLLGAHATYTNDWLKVAVFGSPLFIPDRGAPLDFADGRLESISPWSISPPYQVKFQGQVTPVRYNAEIPAMKEIVVQPSFATMVKVEGKSGYWGKLSYAYQPMNQLLMSYSVYHNDSTSEVEATLYPRVGYHHLIGAETGYASRSWDSTLAALADLPRDDVPATDAGTFASSGAPPPKLMSQVVSNAILLSPTVQYKFRAGTTAGGGLRASYIHKFGTELADIGYFADGSTQFDSRFPFQDSALVEVTSPTWRKFSADTRILYDVKHPGTIVSWLFQYEPAYRWTVYLSTDVLTSWTANSPEVGTDFIHRYRANDRVMGGLTYVF